MTDDRVRFEVAGAQALPVGDASVDVAASALVLNFVPDRQAALAEIRRALKPEGLLAFYVWDYPNGGIGFIDAFWKAAARIDPKAAALDEATRFPFCTAEGLAEMCRTAGFQSVIVEPLEVETVFPDFEAFWLPFTLGAGPAPGYCASLTEEGRTALKVALAEALGPDRPIRLPARAWAVRARRPA
jgi:SAM-dependent methyltransferase